MTGTNEDRMITVWNRVTSEGNCLPHPSVAIGSAFHFVCDHQRFSATLFGTIQAIHFSGESGLELHVSNPSFRGIPLKSLVHYQDDVWTIKPMDVRSLAYAVEVRGKLTIFR
jgi:hypothetical protein